MALVVIERFAELNLVSIYKLVLAKAALSVDSTDAMYKLVLAKAALSADSTEVIQEFVRICILQMRVFC
jgi:hypothetical protein